MEFEDMPAPRVVMVGQGPAASPELPFWKAMHTSGHFRATGKQDRIDDKTVFVMKRNWPTST